MMRGKSGLKKCRIPNKGMAVRKGAHSWFADRVGVSDEIAQY
jgi:hypothetical protein